MTGRPLAGAGGSWASPARSPGSRPTSSRPLRSPGASPTPSITARRPGSRSGCWRSGTRLSGNTRADRRRWRRRCARESGGTEPGSVCPEPGEALVPRRLARSRVRAHASADLRGRICRRADLARHRRGRPGSPCPGAGRLEHPAAARTLRRRAGMTPAPFSAVVVGSGVAGAIVAKELGLRGFRVLVLEAGLESPMDDAGFRGHVRSYLAAPARGPNSPFPRNPNAPHPNPSDLPLDRAALAPARAGENGYLASAGPCPSRAATPVTSGARRSSGSAPACGCSPRTSASVPSTGGAWTGPSPTKSWPRSTPGRRASWAWPPTRRSRPTWACRSPTAMPIRWSRCPPATRTRSSRRGWRGCASTSATRRSPSRCPPPRRRETPGRIRGATPRARGLPPTPGPGSAARATPAVSPSARSRPSTARSGPSGGRRPTAWKSSPGPWPRACGWTRERGESPAWSASGTAPRRRPSTPSRWSAARWSCSPRAR